MAEDAVPPKRLHILAESVADVPLLSALAQDAVVRLVDVSYDRRARRLGLMLSRFCREFATPRRVKSVLTIGCITGIKRRSWPEDQAGVLTLLAVRAERDAILIDFADGVSLKAETECVDLLLDDVGTPWPARLVPSHPEV